MARGVVAASCALLLPASAQEPLRLVSRIELPGTNGRLDHMAYAPDSKLLFVAGLGADKVEVIDLAASRRAAQLAASEPQGIAYSPALHRVYVANGKAGTLEAFEGGTRVAIARDLPDADNLRLDPASGLLFVGYGRSLAALDPRSLTVMRRFPVPGHPEAFEVSGSRIYANVPTAQAVVVVDQMSGKTVATWSVAPDSANFPMAIDASAHRLFVATRRPARLLVFDADSGRRVAQVSICGDADDLLLDRERRRLYAICGDGHVHVIGVRGADRYEIEQRLPTANGARTGLLVPALARLFVAAPARRDPAAVLVFETD